MSEEKQKVPQHVAVIMDGNGRWAKARGWPRLKGHQEGAQSLRAILRACRDHGVKYLTVYAFSSENWIRPKAEVSGLMTLLRTFLRKQEFELRENKVRLRMIGRMEDLPAAVQKELQRVMAATAHYTEHQLILALSYGSRDEITAACRQIAREAQAGRLDPAKITPQTIAQHLYLPDVPDPDLLIRTSGEMRISNFLLWQISYAELYVTPVLWPDFREPQFAAALADYAGRHRRFGDIK
ncbi:MAG: isoprenyl transferase [Kiritimatiellaeota bacterium]|nr:isoprenyl transferase [Kiritimatiellota bacterium]